MMPACRKFLGDRLQELTLLDGETKPYLTADPGKNVFYDDLPDGFLKDNDFAVCCLPLKDSSKKYGKRIARTRSLGDQSTAPEPTEQLTNENTGSPLVGDESLEPLTSLGNKPFYSVVTRRFSREILFRCLLYGSSLELWGDDTRPGIAERFQKAMAQYKVIADQDNSAIKIEQQDIARPWDADVEMDKKLRRPRLAIVRVLFTGGIQATENISIATGVSITPNIGNHNS